jgi:APA family basic amino acid/polyamine antiporter
MAQSRSGQLVQGIGPVAATALVAGNIVGSGIYVIPASLASVAGPLSLVAWVLCAAAFLCLTSVFADLGRAYPVSGGPQAFVQRAFGDFAGLQGFFLYWISQVIGNAAYLTAFVGYLAVLRPAAGAPLAAFLAAQALLWSLTFVNILGARVGGAVQVVTTVLKILPLVVLAVPLLAHASAANARPFAPHGLGALFPALSLLAWIYLGSESVTVPAEEVRGAGRTIRRSAYAGFAIATGVYLLIAAALTFGLPAGAIADTPSPLAVAARHALGSWGETLVTLGALVSILGVLNGWLLVTGRLPFAAAREGLAPVPLGRLLARTGTPATALLLSSFLTGALVLLYFVKSLLAAYNFVALFSACTSLVAIGGACAAEIALLRREPDRFTAAQRRRGPYTACVGLAAVLLLIVGAGGWVALLTLLCMLLPAAYYARVCARRRNLPARIAGGSA